MDIAVDMDCVRGVAVLSPVLAIITPNAIKTMIDPRAYPFIAIIVILVVVACAIMIRDIVRDIRADKRRGAEMKTIILTDKHVGVDA